MASNCSGAFLLGKAGVLDGKRATTWAGGEKGLAKAYPNINVQYGGCKEFCVNGICYSLGILSSN